MIEKVVNFLLRCVKSSSEVLFFSIGIHPRSGYLARGDDRALRSVVGYRLNAFQRYLHDPIALWH